MTHLTRAGVSAVIQAQLGRRADAYLTYPYARLARTVGVMRFADCPAAGVDTYISCDLFQRSWDGRRYEIVVAGRVFGERLGYVCGNVATYMFEHRIEPKHGLVYPDVFKLAGLRGITTPHGVFVDAYCWGEEMREVRVLGTVVRLSHLLPINPAELVLVQQRGVGSFLGRLGAGSDDDAVDAIMSGGIDDRLLVDPMDLCRELGVAD